MHTIKSHTLLLNYCKHFFDPGILLLIHARTAVSVDRISVCFGTSIGVNAVSSAKGTMAILRTPGWSVLIAFGWGNDNCIDL